MKELLIKNLNRWRQLLKKKIKRLVARRREESTSRSSSNFWNENAFVVPWAMPK